MKIRKTQKAQGPEPKAEKPRSFGKPGYLEFQVQQVAAVDGQQVPLSGVPSNLEGESRPGTAVAILVIGLLFFVIGAFGCLLVKGKDAEAPAGTTVNASTAGSAEVTTN